ncbi:transposable element Tcb1 transposase [Trichonephila clavipes]|uniref:Transposable element Tcb1 transposase n=1 Tax=Trichonephila clavipes TaxID=2585209 RepID=A0A8X7BDT8_TRICX|nr:transposable element Tcb1 transposase [Trichonephila clavipes]
MTEAGSSARRVTRQLGRSDCVVKGCWNHWIQEKCYLSKEQAQSTLDRLVCEKIAKLGPCVFLNPTKAPERRTLGSRYPLRVLPLRPTHRHFRLEWSCTRENWTAAEWNQVVFSDESRFNLCSDDNPVRVWRPLGESLNHAFALQQHTAPDARGIIWGAIAYNTQSPLVLIHGTMKAQRYVHDILQQHVLPLMQRLP